MNCRIRILTTGTASKMGTPARRGVILPLVAILLPAMLILLGFAIDLTYMQMVRTELRATVDLSSKAAAATLARTADTTSARAAALDVANQNRIAGVPLTLQPTDVVFGRSTKQGNGSYGFAPGLSPFNAVRVTGRRTDNSSNGAVPLFFSRLYSTVSFEPQVAATTAFSLIDICLVLDRSTSMKLSISDPGPGMSTTDPRLCLPPDSVSRWIALANAVSAFSNIIDNANGNAQVGIVTFASDESTLCGNFSPEVATDLDLTSTMSSVNSAMNARSTTVWNGNTHIDAGIRQGHQVLTSSPAARDLAEKMMIVLTDGIFNGADPEADAIAAHADEITIHTITFSDNANQADMIRVANAGGGDHFHAPDEAALKNAFKELASTIAAQLVE